MIDVKPTPGIQVPPNITKDPPLSKWMRSMWETLSMLRLGKMSCVFSQVFAAGATTTIVQNAYLTHQSVIVINALTPEAASFLLTPPGVYALEANRGIGEWTFTHASMPGPLETIIAVIG